MANAHLVPFGGLLLLSGRFGDLCGRASSHTPGFGTGALAPLLAYVVRRAKAATPLLPLRVFRSRNASGATGVQALMVAGMCSLQFPCVLYPQKVLGFGEFRTPGSGPRSG